MIQLSIFSLIFSACGHTGEERELSHPYPRRTFVLYQLHNTIILSYLGLLGPFPTFRHNFTMLYLGQRQVHSTALP